MKAYHCQFLACCFILFALQTDAQENPGPKNFPEIFAGIEWNSISGLTGVSYERSVFQKNKWVFGLKATHIFQYERANLEWLHSGYDGTVSISYGTATAHKFFNNQNRGLFLLAEIGTGRRIFRYEALHHESLIMAGEGGIGWQFLLNNRFAVRWTNSLAFGGNGGITMTKLSVGF